MVGVGSSPKAHSHESRRRAGAHLVVETGGLGADAIVGLVRDHAPGGVDHVVEVAFHPNIAVDGPLLVGGGSIATYATADPNAVLPFWSLVFKNIRLFFLGSDDFPLEAKLAATLALNETLEGQWAGFEVEARFPLESIAEAHEAVEGRKVADRVVLNIRDDDPVA